MKRPDFMAVFLLLTALLLLVIRFNINHCQAAEGQTDSQWDILYSFNIQDTLLAPLCFGVEFGGGCFFVTDASATGASPNHYSILDPTGTLLGRFEQPTGGWGWRDPAFDGTYFYCGLEGEEISALDTLGVIHPEAAIPRPYSVDCIRALAYDPATDHFWTADYAENIVEFDRSGNIVWEGSPAPLNAIYGMCWDDAAPDGPWLWIHDQLGGCTFHQFDPINRSYTGVSYTVPLLPGLTSQMAGGCGFTNQWDTDYWTIVAMAQGTPMDWIFVMEMYPATIPDVTVTLTPAVQPIQIPASGGSFDFNIAVANGGTTQVTGDVWTNVLLPNGSLYGPIIGPVNLDFAPGWSGNRDRTQNIPANAPPGNYTYQAYVGIDEETIWDQDSFDFEKLTTGDGVEVSDWANFG
ncbi:MAG: hypothetical protein ABIE92_00265, partial [bacterium]